MIPRGLISVGKVELVVVDDVGPQSLVELHDRVVETVAPQYLVWEVGRADLSKFEQSN